ncbi:MAG: TonB-dependent receptor, partial [Hyphomonas sp.]|nr:TonB-dependent receptor [Hyphomonas sp.]
LEVYKTGQAILPSGGIGATVNIKTRRPLDSADPGISGTVGAKLNMDTSVDRGDDITPELSGILNWVNPNETFGVGLFASYSKRDSGAASAQINDWIVRRAEGGIDSSYLRGDGSTVVTNMPADGELYAIPQDSRYDFADLSRERLNGQLVFQFRPSDTLSLTADYTFAQNENDELRYEQTNWFATPMDQIIFDTGQPVATAVYMQEFNGGTKDIGFEQTNRATKDTLDSFGFNAEWELSDHGKVVFDAHTSKAESGGNNPLGHLATFTGIGAPVINQHSVDYRTGYPIQAYEIDDSARGNNNGVLDVGDVATQVFRSTSTDMEHQVDEFDLRYVWENDNSNFTVGANYRGTEMTSATSNTQQDLGSWGLAFPGDIEQYAPGLLEQYCLSCQFNDVPVGQADIAFRADAVDLWRALAPLYEGFDANNDGVSDHPINVTPGSNTVEENILALYAAFGMQAELAGRPARINVGLRYEDTDVKSSTVQNIPQGILWTADNDFQVLPGSTSEDVSGEGSYDHFLPNVDFSIDLTDNLVARASYSKTIGRAAYTNLYANETANAPNRPTVLGGSLTGSSNNPNLLPLESDNFDVSLEWYYGDTNYVSVGYFRKDTQNFIGQGVVEQNLFGLRDQTGGISGSRSGDALDIISSLGVDQSEANLFTLVALIDANNGNVAAAQSEFQANLVNGVLPQGYVDSILAAYDVVADGNDPLALFAVQKPLNADDAEIDGWEIALQHFFGDTGFGVAANYTLVDGDVTLDPAGDPNANQFALVGLSDSANLTLIYENHGWSARLAYNWRDTFLNATNQGGDRSGIYTEDYDQIDLSVSYDIWDKLTVAFEGINLTGEDQRQYHRVPAQVYYAYELEPRYSLGLRYKF